MSASCTSLAVSAGASVVGSVTAGSVICNGALNVSGVSSLQATTFNTTTLFTNPPNMSGASISTGTIQSGSIIGDCLTLNASTNQTKTAGNLTIGSGANLTTTNAITGSITSVQAIDTNNSTDNCYFALFDLGPAGYNLSASTASKQSIKSDGNVSYIPSSKTMIITNQQTIGVSSLISGSSLTMASGSAASIAGTVSLNSGGSLTLASGSTMSVAGAETVASGGTITLASGSSMTIALGATFTMGCPITSTNAVASTSFAQLGYSYGTAVSASLSATVSSINSIQLLGTGASAPYAPTSTQFGVYQLTISAQALGMTSTAWCQIGISTSATAFGSGGAAQSIYLTSPSISIPSSGSFTTMLGYYGATSKLYLLVQTNASTISSGTYMYEFTRIA